jgi:hypothetical protein
VFQVGDTVIKPSIGICRIKAIRRLQIEDRSEAYYVIQSGEVDVLVPKKLADSGALRSPMNEESLKRIYEALEAPYKAYPVDPGEDLPRLTDSSPRTSKRNSRSAIPPSWSRSSGIFTTKSTITFWTRRKPKPTPPR